MVAGGGACNYDFNSNEIDSLFQLLIKGTCTFCTLISENTSSVCARLVRLQMQGHTSLTTLLLSPREIDF